MSSLLRTVRKYEDREGNVPLETLLRLQEDKSSAARRLITQGYFLASAHHRNEPREDGRYKVLHHLTDVALILDFLGYGAETVVGGLLHDKEKGKLTDIDTRIEALSPVSFGITFACSEQGNGKEAYFISKQVQKEEFLMTFLLISLAFPEAIPVKSADRLTNLWESSAYSLPRERRILAETVNYYLPLIESFDFVLHGELSEVCEHLKHRHSFFMQFQEFRRYEVLDEKLLCYSQGPERQMLRDFIHQRHEAVDSQILKYTELGINTLTLLYKRSSFDAPKMPLTFISSDRSVVEWVNLATDIMFRLIKQRGIRNYIEYFFEQDGRKGSPVLSSEFRYGYTVKDTQAFMQQISQSSVLKLEELSTYISNCDQSTPYLRVSSEAPLDNVIAELTTILGAGEPAIVYEKSFNCKGEGIRIIYDVSAPRGIALPGNTYPRMPFLVVDVIEKKKE